MADVKLCFECSQVFAEELKIKGHEIVDAKGYKIAMVKMSGPDFVDLVRQKDLVYTIPVKKSVVVFVHQRGIEPSSRNHASWMLKYNRDNAGIKARYPGDGTRATVQDYPLLKSFLPTMKAGSSGQDFVVS